MYYAFQRPLKELAQKDVDWLIEEGVQESKYIDYKERFYEMKNDHGKVSLCKDLCSFANSSGGDLVVGVKEKDGQDKGKPAEITPLSEPFESLREWVLHVANARVKPRLNLDFQEIQISDGEGKPNGIVMVIRVLPSFSEKPHLLPAGQDAFQYWVRADGQNSPVTDHQEIRRAFLDSEVYEERIRNWRNDRLAKIVAGEIPISVKGNQLIVLQIVPVGTFQTKTSVDFRRTEREVMAFTPIGASGANHCFNFDGSIWFTGSSPQDEQRSYCLFGRHGEVEAVCKAPISERDRKKYLACIRFEEDLIEACKRYLHGYDRLGIAGPFAVFVSLLGLRGCYMANKQGWFREYDVPFDRDNFIFPEVVIEDCYELPHQFLKHIFDAMWNAADFPECPHYDEEGNYNPER